MSCAEVSKQAEYPNQQIKMILQNIFHRMSWIQQIVIP